MPNDDPVRVEDFKKLAALVNVYELQPGKHYLIVAEGKHFSYDLAHTLMRNILLLHPELDICIVATLYPKSIEVRKEQNDERPNEA